MSESRAIHNPYHAAVQPTTTADTVVIPARAGYRFHITGVKIANLTATVIPLNITDGAAGTSLLYFRLLSSAAAGCNESYAVPEPGIRGTLGNGIYVTLGGASATGTNVHITGYYSTF